MHNHIATLSNMHFLIERAFKELNYCDNLLLYLQVSARWFKKLQLKNMQKQLKI